MRKQIHVYTYNDYTMNVCLQNEDTIPGEYIFANITDFDESKELNIYYDKDGNAMSYEIPKNPTPEGHMSISSEYRLKLTKTDVKDCRITGDKLHVYTYEDYTVNIRFENNDFIPSDIIYADKRDFHENDEIGKQNGIFIDKDNNSLPMTCIKMFDSGNEIDTYIQWFTDGECKKYCVPVKI